MTKKFKIILVVYIGLAVLLSVLGLYAYQIFFQPNVLAGKKEPVAVYIRPGADFKQVMDSLLARQIVGDHISFRFVAKVLKYQELVKPGRYLLQPNMTNLAAVRKLRSGAQDPVKVTFNNVRTKKDLAGKICRNLLADSAKFLAQLNSPAETGKVGFDTTNILAMFLPNTYEMYWTVDEAELLKKMHKEYEKFWTPARKAKAEEIGLSPLKVSVLASIVEAETKKRDEAKVIAGLYMNRLQQNMRLEADPTVIYGIGNFAIRRLTFADLAFDSPYNTYRYTGLPPGPINLPPVQAIEAVLNYDKNKYIFMCAKEDFSGYHAFAETFAEHKVNAAKYRAALDRIGIR
jgi:UPF0755 protein